MNRPGDTKNLCLPLEGSSDGRQTWEGRKDVTTGQSAPDILVFTFLLHPQMFLECIKNQLAIGINLQKLIQTKQK